MVVSLTRKLAVTLALALLTAGTAQATVIFSDDFNSENGGVGALNYNGFVNWTVTDGTVDLIGNGFFDLLPGNGLYVDMDGSTGNAGIMGSVQNLDAGTYTLSFDLAGNQRDNAAEQTDVNVSVLGSLGLAASQSFSLGRTDPFSRFSLDFTLGTSSLVNLSFGAAGGDNIGMLLDNVVLETKTAQVPEPASVMLLALGLLTLGALRKKAA